MSIEIIQQKLLDYNCKSILDQENALKEIAQEIVLMALSRAGFFRVAAFQGGTCLRILYGLERFSEDLDFVLENPDKKFDWEIYIRNMAEEFSAYGFSLEVINRNKLDKAIRVAFLKADSEGGILVIKDSRSNRPRLNIKLEIDVNPPHGSTYELKYLDFPLAYSVLSQDLSSLFASKSHALLCRPYTKGRDWYDFSWYVARKAIVNFSLLQYAVNQSGPWKNQNIIVTPKWYLKELRSKIKEIDWEKAKIDVERFLRPKELDTLGLWSTGFFLSRLDKLESYIFPK
jgi:predicted nucleotidyltransferase component of viral defense system